MIQCLTVGSGLIANNFQNVQFEKKVVIFASGVSNSLETSVAEFQREKVLLTHTIDNYRGHHIVYFSSCSANTSISSPYVKHKQNMENVVLSSESSFNVFRLPQLVGRVKNSTLISYLVNTILDGKSFNVQSLATRNLLDIVDLVRVVKTLINHNLGLNSIQNIASLKSVPVLDIVSEISKILQLSPKFDLVPDGYCQNIDIEFLQKTLNLQDVLLKDDYWVHVLRRYVSVYGLES